MKKGEGACLVCGKPLIYFQSPQKLVCIRCGNTSRPGAAVKTDIIFAINAIWSKEWTDVWTFA